MSEGACQHLPYDEAGKVRTEQRSALAARRVAIAAMDRRLWHLALPAIGEYFLQTSILLVDTVMISYYDPSNRALLAASSVAGTILWRAHMTLGCIEKGTTAMVARYSGEGDREKVGRVVAQSIWLALLIGAVISICGVCYARELLASMGAAPDVVAAGTPFLQAIFLASVFRMYFFVASASLRGAGDTRSPMQITLWMNGVNLVGNYLLIFGSLGFPRLGLTGSGISTALSITFAAVCIAWILVRGRTRFQLHLRHFRPDFVMIRTLLRISWPALLEEILVSIGFLYFISAITRLGTDVLAAHTVSTRVESLSFMAGAGFAVAAATLVGQSLGAGSLETARLAFRRTTLYCVLVMSTVSAGLIIFGYSVVGWIYPGDESVRSLAWLLLIIAALEQPLLAICSTLGAGIRGAGDTISPMAISVFGNVGIRLGICWLAGIFGWGIVGIYIATVVDWAVRCGLLFAAYYSGRWTRIRM